MSRIELHVTDFLEFDLLNLVAVLLVLVHACFLRLVGTDQSFLLLAHWLDGFLLALVADLPGLLLAVLGVAVLLRLLGACLHFQFADFLRLEMAVLLFNREGDDVATLCRLPLTDNSLRSITIVLGTLIPLAVELYGVCTGHVVDNLLLHVAVGGLDIGALVVVLGGHVDLVGGVAHSVLPREAPLDLVSLLECLVVYGLHQIADKLVHVKTNPLDLPGPEVLP